MSKVFEWSFESAWKEAPNDHLAFEKLGIKKVKSESD